MKRLALLVVATCAAALIVGFSKATAGGTTVICTDAFSGTAFNVIVPDENFCVLSGATVTHDVIIGRFAGAGAGVEASESGLTVGHDVTLQKDSEVDFGATLIGHDLIGADNNDSFHLERTTIRHDMNAFEPGTVQTGQVGPDTPGGPVQVGHDLVIQGSPPDNDFVFDGMCDLTVGHDFRMIDRSVTLGVGFGDQSGVQEVCSGSQSNTIGHDLIFAGNSALSGFFGPSSIDVGNNRVGHDLIFAGNTAVLGGSLEVSDNVVGHDAICANNSPAPSGDDSSDGPNIVGHANTCG